MASIEWTLTGTARRKADIPQGATVVAVNGVSTIGECESCGRYILETSNYYEWADGIVTCSRCVWPKQEIPHAK